MKSRIMTALAATLAILLGLMLASCDRKSSTPPKELEQNYWVQEVATHLDLPRAVVWLPGGDMLVTEWAGKIRRMRGDKTVAWLDGVPKVFEGTYDGLRDIQLDPDFSQNHQVYLTYTDGNIDTVHSRVFRARLAGDKLVDGKVIFTARPATPPGMPLVLRILFLPDKTMLVGVGSNDWSGMLVQRLDSDLGKIIRINRDGSVPKDNPFLSDPQALPEIWALGLRAPHGIVRSDDGKLWSVEIGPKGGDELNLLKPGANYGWPSVSWGFDYSGAYLSQRQEGGTGFTDSVLTWVPSFAPSDLAQYRGKRYPFWDGDLFVSGLVGQSLYRLRIRNDKVILQERLLTDLHERIRTVVIGPDNLLYILTDAYGQGRILRLVPGAPGKDAHIARVLFGADADEGDYRKGVLAPDEFKDAKEKAELESYRYEPVKSAQSFAQFCSGCHTFKQFKTGRVGPDLNDIVGRRSGTLSGYGYSAAFSDPKRQLTWNYLTLGNFLRAPQFYFPDTRMSIPPLPRQTQARIVDFLTDGQYGTLFEETRKKREEAQNLKTHAPR